MALNRRNNESDSSVITEVTGATRRSADDKEAEAWRAAEKSLNLATMSALPEDGIKKYWPTVLELVEWIYAESSNKKGAASILDTAREKGRGTPEYDRAVSVINSMISERLAMQPLPLGMRIGIVNQLVQFEILGLSIVDPIWNAKDKKGRYIVEEVWINGPNAIQFVSGGRKFFVKSAKFKDANHVLKFCDTIIAQANRSDLQVSQTNPNIDARLADLSRVAIMHPAINPGGPSIAIRRHATEYISLTQMTDEWHTMNREIVLELARYIKSKMSVLVIGETSSGKTTLLNALSGTFPRDARIITIEDVLELELNPNKPFKVPGWEARQPKKTDKGLQGGFTIRQHVKASLRMSPDIVVIGEVRDAAAYDLVDAANTGHQVFSTLHANGPEDAIVRLTNLISMGGEVAGPAALPMIASAFDLIVTAERLEDGSRKITDISEVGNTVVKDESTGEDVVKTRRLWHFETTGKDENGRIIGDWVKDNDVSDLTATRHRLKFVPYYTWDELLEIEGFDGKIHHRSRKIEHNF